MLVAVDIYVVGLACLVEFGVRLCQQDNGTRLVPCVAMLPLMSPEQIAGLWWWHLARASACWSGAVGMQQRRRGPGGSVPKFGENRLNTGKIGGIDWA